MIAEEPREVPGGSFYIFCRMRPGDWPLKQRERIMQKWARKFYKSAAWHKCREAYIRKRVGIDGGICEECKDNLGYIVHHKTALTELTINDPEISLNEENLEFVCKPCHDEFDGHGIRRAHDLGPIVIFDATGMPIARSHTCARARGRENGGAAGPPKK